MVSPEMPVIVEEPQNVDSEFLETVTLVCEAQGNPDPLYTWYKVGTHTLGRVTKTMHEHRYT